MSRECTIVIAARNAAATIARAVRSARAQACARIVLVDHASTDETAALARDAGGETLDVLEAPADATLGRVRQVALDAVETEFGLSLDADDELMPGRAARLVDTLNSQPADIAYDEVELHDGATGAPLRRLPIPLFLDGAGIAREFERNYIPSIGFPAFRTEAARRIGYDAALHGAEDVDFLLRAIAAGERIALVREAGYRQYAYPASLSRDADNQLAMLRVALRKHQPPAIETALSAAAVDGADRFRSMATFLTLRGDYDAALARVRQLPAGEERDFREGTLLAGVGRFADALPILQRAADEAAPERLNNLGVVLAALGRPDEAASMFRDALRRFPGYRDASANLAAATPVRLTWLPRRTEPVRHD